MATIAPISHRLLFRAFALLPQKQREIDQKMAVTFKYSMQGFEQ
jgi:hypothetical protein